MSATREGPPHVEGGPDQRQANRVLLLEDNPGDTRLIREAFAEVGEGAPSLVHATTLAAAVARASEGGFDAVLLDLHVPDSQGLDTLRHFQAVAPTLPVLVLTGLTDSALALQAVQEGAQDFLVKGETTAFALVRALWYAIERKRSEEGLRLLSEAGRRLARSFNMPEVLADVARLLVETLADGAGVVLLDRDGRPLLAALEHLHTERADRLREWMTGQPTGVPPIVAEVLQSGQARQQSSVHWEMPAAPVGRGPDTPRPGIVSIVGTPLVARQDVLGVLLSIRDGAVRRRPFDSTDQALLEALARRIGLSVENARLYEQARDAVRLRDEFLMLVTHDLRNPLAGLRMQIESAQQYHARVAPSDGLEAQAWSETERLLSASASTVDSLSEQVGELLDVARLQVGATLGLRRGSSDLVALVGEVCVGQGQASRVSVQSQVTSLVGEWDALRLRRVLSNLVGNALHYSPASSIVEVTIERERQAGSIWAVVGVADRGVGIPEDELERIFDPFFRASTAPENVGGSGLGLAGSRQIVAQHGGTLRAAQRPGGGTTFALRLPLATPEELSHE